ncbi:hypothetical protein XM38_002810 [Halomicronema hongdechloris C2206]|uniref:Uncharacterized protein n=1 Tax=Halomicronema hongdechloris C2206 TaxID=1641165 RepID=A0A1Z3HGF0_9CYAN|nr:hypothetical protein [Halomicronema hongdechloris]ASC69354.1 hypothetical protein XM38_002810 [Halomicronema hongdechloris C2206]
MAFSTPDPADGLTRQDMAHYIEATDGLSKPWLLVTLRLKALQEQRAPMSPDDYMQALRALHQDLMELGEWWIGREDEVF